MSLPRFQILVQIPVADASGEDAALREAEHALAASLRTARNGFCAGGEVCGETMELLCRAEKLEAGCATIKDSCEQLGHGDAALAWRDTADASADWQSADPRKPVKLFRGSLTA